MGSIEGKAGWTALFALGLAFPFLAGNDYHLTVMSTAYIYALATIGLNLITGYTGQFNLAHAGFMAVGAYTVGILTVDHQVPFWIAFALSGVTATVLGFFVGIVSLRLKGHYFSIFTLCVGYIMFLVIEKWESVEALKKHLEAPHMVRYRRTVKDMVTGVSIRVLEPA